MAEMDECGWGVLVKPSCGVLVLITCFGFSVVYLFTRLSALPWEVE
jgi:hypothetical protein